jgi:GDP-4-dehydro-6-deoxy-D-mannose reductase
VTAPATAIPLVTGAAGFAGSHLVQRLLHSHERVAAWSNRGNSRPLAANGRIVWQTVDVTDRAAVDAALAAVQPAAIFHCAGIAHVAESWADAARPLHVNAFGTTVLLDAVTDHGLRCPVVLAGSALVYRPSLTALTEHDPLGPADPYGISKLAQEAAGRRSAAHVVLTRPFNHAGPRQPPSFVTSSFAKQIAEIETGTREPVLLVGNLDARRDLTDVRDTVRAYELLASSGRRAVPYNICSGTAWRVGDLLELLLSQARVRITVRQDQSRMRPSDNPLVLGDHSRLTADTGWRPEIPIERTLADLLAWWREQIPLPGRA